MPDENAALILRLLAEGHLSVEEADRLLGALDADAHGPRPALSASGTRPAAPASQPPRQAGARALRVRVREGGRQVVNLQVPMSLAASAAALVPGLSDEHVGRIRAAIEAGSPTTIVDVTDDDTSVLVSLE